MQLCQGKYNDPRTSYTCTYVQRTIFGEVKASSNLTTCLISKNPIYHATWKDRQSIVKPFSITTYQIQQFYCVTATVLDLLCSAMNVMVAFLLLALQWQNRLYQTLSPGSSLQYIISLSIHSFSQSVEIVPLGFVHGCKRAVRRICCWWHRWMGLFLFFFSLWCMSIDMYEKIHTFRISHACSHMSELPLNLVLCL